MNNIPTEEGQYLWKDTLGFMGEKNSIYLIDVVDCGKEIDEKWLRVPWKCGYYNVVSDDFTSEGECWPKEGWL